MAFTAENVEEAVQQFYKDAANQKDINRWLMSAQTSQQAWQYCWQLMAPDKTHEVQFFGASTLHIKIARFWHEVPAEQVDQLRKQLFQEIMKFCAGPKIVLTRLCVVLSSFILQTVPESWSNSVSDIISTFQQTQDTTLESTQACHILLEILTILPEEFESSQFPQQRKSSVRAEIKKGMDQVLALIEQCFGRGTPQTVHGQAIRCLSAWIQFGIPLPAVEPFLNHLFHVLMDESYFDISVEALMNVFSHPECNRYPRLVQKMLINIIQLEPIFLKAIEEKDMELCQGLCKLIVCAADQNTDLLLHLTLSGEDLCQLALSLVNMVMQCTSLPGYYPVDENTSNLPFGFWYNLQDSIMQKEHNVFVELMKIYTHVYMRLAEILLKKAEYPSDMEYSSWNAEEKEDHRCYRQDIADTLMYVYNLLRDLLLGSLCQLLKTSLQRSVAVQVRWQEVEAILFAVASVSEGVDHDEENFLPELFIMLSSVPCDNYQVISQALNLIGSYAEWISSHPNMLVHVIPLLLQGVKDVELAQSATLSLKEIVRENQDHLLPYAEQILASSKDAMDSANLKSRDIVRLMSCIGYVLSVLPINDLMKYLDLILSPHIQQLQELAQTEPSTVVKSAIQLRLQMLSWLFSSLLPQVEEVNIEHQSQPVLIVLEQILPVLRIIIRKWISDGGIVESMCDMLKRALRAVMSSRVSLLSDLARLLLEMYQVAPQAVMLDLGKQILLLSIVDSQHQEAAQRLFDALCVTSLTLLETDAQNHPDLFEGFMVLLAQLTKKHKRYYEQTTCSLEKLFDIGILGLCMNESHTIKASCHYINEFISSSESMPAVKSQISQRGFRLVDQLIKSVAGESPRAVLDTLADILLTLNKQHPECLCKWLNDIIVQDNYPHQRVTRDTKTKFARAIIMEKVSKRKVREIVQEYGLIWRGLIGTEYAVQTLQMTR